MKAPKVLVAIVALAIVGFAWNGYWSSAESVAPEPQFPARPTELDSLDPFVGTWEVTCKAKIPGSTDQMIATGKGKAEWRFENMFLVDEFTYDLGEMGTMTGMNILGWDPRARKYRSWSFSSLGETATGTMTYEEEVRLWHLEVEWRDAVSGEMAYGETRINMIDENTIETQFKQWDNAAHQGQPSELVYLARRLKS